MFGQNERDIILSVMFDSDDDVDELIEAPVLLPSRAIKRRCCGGSG